MAKCARCKGSGSADCPKCGGKGKTGGLYIPFITEVTGLGEDGKCKDCNGSGESPCPVCRGAGTV